MTQMWGPRDLDGPDRDDRPDSEAADPLLTDPSSAPPPSSHGSGSSPSVQTGSPEPLALPAKLEPGTVVLEGKYVVERSLGQGAMGSVWLVRHKVFDRLCALKILINTANDFDGKARVRFRREAKLMASFEHPNAVAVYDAEIGTDRAYIVMAYVPGIPLNKYPGFGHPFAADWTSRLLGQLCDVLDLAHERRIVHRDLKPSNLMLVDGPQAGRPLVKLLDLGIAKDLKQQDELHTGDGNFLGTPSYASPEQILGHKVDARSDLYSLGVLLYELLTGTRPFHGNAAKVMVEHTHSKPPPFAAVRAGLRVPEGVEPLVLRCLEKNPERRPQSARELAEEFAGCIARAATQGSATNQFIQSPDPPAAGSAPPAIDPHPTGSPTNSFIRDSSRSDFESGSATAEPFKDHRLAPTAAATIEHQSSAYRPSSEMDVAIDRSEEDFEHAPETFQGSSWSRPRPVIESGAGVAIDEPIGATTTVRRGIGWRLPIAAALIVTAGAGLAANRWWPPRTVVSVVDGPDDKPPSVDPPFVEPAKPPGRSPQLQARVNQLGLHKFFPARGSKETDGGWPDSIMCAVEDGARLSSPKPEPGSGRPLYFRLVDGFYLPVGYEIDREAGFDERDGWPSRIFRTIEEGPAKGREVGFVRIAGGTFQMGDFRPEAKLKKNNPATPAHPVTLSGYYIQEYEVSIGEVLEYFRRLETAGSALPAKFEAFLGEIGEPDQKKLALLAAASLDYDETTDIAALFNGLPPTEAQWEFAATGRGLPNEYVKGQANPETFGQVNILGAGVGVVLPVEKSYLDETEQHVHQMSGNVREWCRDRYQERYDAEKANDPLVKATGSPTDRFVVRGSCLSLTKVYARTFAREDPQPRNQTSKQIGFRMVIEPPPIGPKAIPVP